ncbi:MAG: UDP-4-amino-4,6-dideoxy-N-acetyl-beta-L-altrosamine transaminase [Chlamydiae bacterium]|nr:UDP-4-amino-4,6-dideoxy-N-acetyl-beta-L-altrosamine transaminase [Chlamydiota bacterium]
MSKKFLHYANQSINADDIKAVGKALKSDSITRGPLVQEFEKAIAEFSGANYAVAFNSGTTALDAASYAAEIQPYDRVITTPNSFVGTITGVIKRGATPTFIDIDPKTGNIDLEKLALNINQPSSRGKEVIMPVHYAGIPVDMERLNKMICRMDTVIIEDAAHALGSIYSKGKPVGCCEWSDMTVFSFHPAKHVTTGEGGCVLTNDESLYKRLLLYRNNGIIRSEDAWMYQVTDITGNYNFTDIQAALGLSQLKRVKDFIKIRKKLVKKYRKELQDVPSLEMFPEECDEKTSYHIFVVKIDFENLNITRQELMQKLHEEGIGTQVHYIPLYQHPFMDGAKLGQYFPGMEEFYAKALTLPLHCNMDDKDVVRVCGLLKTFLKP